MLVGSECRGMSLESYPCPVDYSRLYLLLGGEGVCTPSVISVTGSIFEIYFYIFYGYLNDLFPLDVSANLF